MVQIKENGDPHNREQQAEDYSRDVTTELTTYRDHHNLSEEKQYNNTDATFNLQQNQSELSKITAANLKILNDDKHIRSDARRQVKLNEYLN